MQRESESEPVHELSKLPCLNEDCGSSDALTIYTDGHAHCFSCDKHFSPKEVKAAGFEVEAIEIQPETEAEKRQRREQVKQLYDLGEIRALPGWSISQATCKAWDYRTYIAPNGDKLHLAAYKDEHGTLIDVKVRNSGPDGTRKDFYWASGKAPKGLVYGEWRLGKGGRGKLIIAAGEKDAMTVSGLWGDKFPVLSAQAESQIKDLARLLPRINSYDEVVIVPDMDEPGRRSAEKLARMIQPGKALIAKLPYKDANDTLQKAGAEALISAIHNATPFRPDGVVDADELDGALLTPTQWGLSLPYTFMTNWTYGMLGGQVWVIGAGTGIGKSDLAGEIAAHLIKAKEDGGEYVPVAVFNYEAGPVRTLKMLVGKLWNKRFNIPPPKNPDGTPNFDGFVYWQPEDMEAARVYRRHNCAKLFINDHKGAIDWESVKQRLRYLKHEAGIKVGFVDPVAAMVAQEDNDVKALDRLFAEAKALAEELDITIVFVSHLARPKDGKSHEEGGRVELRHFRGSGAIVMWASYVFGLERDQQSDDPDTTLRVLKDRETGDSTGATATLIYNTIIGRLEEKVPELMRGPEPAPLEVSA